MIEEWQKRVVRLDRNQRQSRAEEKILGRNVAHLQENVQSKRGFGEGLYRGREGQIVQRARARTLEKEYRVIGEDRGQEKTPMQQMLIEEERETEHAMCVESRAIWPKTVGKERQEKRE